MYGVTDAYLEAIAKPSRSFRLSGTVRLQSGELIELSDSNVLGTLSVESQCVSGTSAQQDIDIGAACTAKLTMTVKDIGGSDSIADARIRPVVGLKLADGSYEDVPMGIFYVDNSTVKRTRNMVAFSAYDKMIFLRFILTDTMRSTMKGFTPFAACAYVCSLAGIQMSQTAEEVEGFPNGDTVPNYTDITIETAWDLIMWSAQMMGCFARIDRHGKLEFVQFRAEQDELGMIIPVREIPASQRLKTNFADGVVRITRLSMRNSDGGLSSASATSTSTSKRSIELELERNPLIISASSKPLKTFLKDILRVLKTVYFRPFDSSIANDPALDAGDYVRLRGGSIDTQRGYATGIITHNTWVYRGVQTIVNMGSIPAMYMIDDVNTASVAALSDDTETEEETDKIDGEQVVYVQPRSQIEKRLDYLETLINGGSSGVGNTLKQYEVLSDTEIKFNGTTYIFTADGDSGVITGVTTDKGGSFTPTIPGTIANIAMHNAAFMAVAMLSRLGGEPEPAPSSLDQCEYRFNSDSMTTSGTYISWHNQGITNKDTDLEFTGASESDGCGVFIQGTAESRGRLYYDCTAATLSARTVYLVAKGNSIASTRMFHMCGYDGWDGTFGAGTTNNSGKWYFSAYINGPLFASDVPYLQKTVICIRLNEDLTLSLFANGVHIGEMDYTCATKSGNIWFGCTAGRYYDGGGYTYYDFAVANMAHSNDEIIANMKFLMDKYGITT